MLLTTSNITEAIDVAFLDRADIKAYLGPPELQVLLLEGKPSHCLLLLMSRYRQWTVGKLKLCLVKQNAIKEWVHWLDGIHMSKAAQHKML